MLSVYARVSLSKLGIPRLPIGILAIASSRKDASASNMRAMQHIGQEAQLHYHLFMCNPRGSGVGVKQAHIMFLFF
jgi:hypothetical protein